MCLIISFRIKFRFVARNSLSIDIKKCGVVKVRSSEISNFLGYKYKENQLARKMDITLKFEKCREKNLNDAGRVRVVLFGSDVFNGSIIALRRRLIFKQLRHYLVEFKELKMQGTLTDLRNVDLPEVARHF